MPKSTEQISTNPQENPQPESYAERILAMGIENFKPRCVVCTLEVPPKRATSRMKDTCSSECHKVLKAFKKFNILRRHCPACYHPSSPEERADFIRWRKSRGDRREKVGRPSKKNRT